MLHIICNSMAGHGKSARIRDMVVAQLQACDTPFQLHETHYKHHARDIAQNLTADGMEHTIVVMGGDGTIHEVLNGLHDPSKICLGIIPSGSGNDFAAVASIPAHPLEALDLILHGTAKFTDYLDCAGIRGINVIGTGIDINILQRCYAFRHLHGKLKYLVSTILSLLHFQFYRFHLERNGAQESHEGFLICAGNGRRIGGGIRVCPKAIIDDGLIDFVVIDKMHAIREPVALFHLLTGQILRQPYVLSERKTRVSVSFEHPVSIEIDGEIYENLPFDIRLIPNTLRIFRP